ncbi:hypothetical protein DITRI_Ditri08aG0056800 [Diplodiscus trichospermus]
MDRAFQRTAILTNHLHQSSPSSPAQTPSLFSNACLNYCPPELSENYAFDTKEMRKLLDSHHLEEQDWLFGMMRQSKLFNPKVRGAKVFVSPDFNQSMEQQREMTMKRIEYFLEKGVFKGWLTEKGEEIELRKFACFKVLSIFDHSIATKLGVHVFLWGGAIQIFGTKHHHDKWLRDIENFMVKGSFAMTELGHGSNVRGVETVQHMIQTLGSLSLILLVNQLRNIGLVGLPKDADGNVCPNIRIVDCGLKIGLNGVDNGRICSIEDPDQRFAAFMAPLIVGRVNIAVSAVYQSKVGLAIAIRYVLTRWAFSLRPNEPEVLLLDYPSHQRRLLPLVAKTCAMSFAANYLKMLYVKRTPQSNKTIHIVSSSFKATFTWNNMQILQECREACGGQGLKERDLLNRFVVDVSQHKAKGESMERASIMSYQLGKDLGRAFSDQAIFQTFVEVEVTMAAGSLKDVLGKLRSLYALICLEDAAFLRYGYFSVDNAAAMRREISKICSELQPHALAIVSSFYIPDAFLSPIAFNWIDANSWTSV